MSRAEQLARGLQWTTDQLVRFWFVCVCLLGLAFVFFMPPFQTNDETHHWERLYTIGQLDRTCAGITTDAEQIIDVNAYNQIRNNSWKWQFRMLDTALAVKPDETDTLRPLKYNVACTYPVFGYAFPALVMRAGQWLWPSTWGKMIVGFYFARLGNWLFLVACVWFGMRMVPRLRIWFVSCFSVPMVIHQSASINQDSLIVGLHILLLVALWRSRPLWKLIWTVLLTVILSDIKIVFAPLILLALIPLWELAGKLGPPRRRLIFSVALGVVGLVLLSSPWWIAPLMRRTLGRMGAVPWASASEQVELIIADPMQLVDAFWAQLGDNVGHGHLTGGYTSIIAVFGWSQYEVPLDVYHTLLWAALWGLIAGALTLPDGGPELARASGWLERLWTRFMPALSPLLVVFLVDLGFYLVFTKPGSRFIIGVQGRYYFGPLLLVGAGLVDGLHRGVARAGRSLGPAVAAHEQLWRSALALAVTVLAFADFASAWSGSYDVLSNVYYHHGSW